MTPPCFEKDSVYLRRTISELTEEMGLLTMLQDMSKQLISQFDYEKIINMFLDLVKEIVNFRACVLYLYDENTHTYRIADVRGLSEADTGNLKIDEEIINWVLKEGRWTQTALQKKCESKNDDIISILPLKGIGRSLGFLLIITEHNRHVFTPSNTKLLSFISSQAGIALENQDLYSKLSSSKEYIHNILESINNGIVAIDADDRITQINKNATAMLGLRSADIVGVSYRDALTGSVAEIFDNVKERALEDGFGIETLFEYSPADNLKVPLAVSSTLLLDDKGHRMGVIVVFRNMSASKEIERLIQLDELKSQFVSNVSHEFRTPLSIIKSYVEALIDQVDPDDHETRENFLSVVADETDRLATLVSDLLDISRIESGKFDMDLSPVCLTETITAVLKNYEGVQDDHPIITHISDGLPQLLADRDKIIQVFVNLLDNAIRFSPYGGTIDIRAKTAGDFLKCSVSDRGMGMSEADLPKIFNEFYRGTNAKEGEIKGTGLGLPIVKHIIESHGGTIHVSSKEGEGTDFTFMLPFRMASDHIGAKHQKPDISCHLKEVWKHSI